jgi:hypothetical protein
LLHVSLTSTRQKSPLQSFPVRPPMPSARAQLHRDGVVESQSSSLPTSGSPSKLFTAVLELLKDPRFGHMTKDIHFIRLTHPAMLQEYVASTIGPNDYAWLSEMVSTVAVKAVLISFDFSAVRMPIISSAAEKSVKLRWRSRRTSLSCSAPAIRSGRRSTSTRKSAFGRGMPARKWCVGCLNRDFKRRMTS